MTVLNYDLARVMCTVGSVPISGYGDGGVSISWASQNFERTANADGTGSIYSATNDKGATATIEVLVNSQAYKNLDAAMRNQLTGDRDLNIGFFLRDPSNGDTVRSRPCVFMNQPDMSKGKTPGSATFELSIEPRRQQIIRGGAL